MMKPPAEARRPAGALVALLILAACDRSAGGGGEAVAKPPTRAPLAPTAATASPAQATAAPASVAAPLPVTLVLTWMPPDQPPQTTQMGFRDLTACERARDEAIAESRRLAAESAAPARGAIAAPAERHYVGNTLISGAPPPPPTVTPPPPPRVAAICAGG